MNNEFEDIPLQGEEPEPSAIRASDLLAIIQALDADPRLQAIFGRPVSDHLMVVAQGWDLRIECYDDDISEENGQTFLKILDEVIRSLKGRSEGH